MGWGFAFEKVKGAVSGDERSTERQAYFDTCIWLGPNTHNTQTPTQDIDKKIKDKEHHRVTKSMPLSEEKKLLREIDLLKKQKAALKVYHVKDEDIQVRFGSVWLGVCVCLLGWMDGWMDGSVG
jgi:hypothetical protein